MATCCEGLVPADSEKQEATKSHDCHMQNPFWGSVKPLGSPIELTVSY